MLLKFLAYTFRRLSLHQLLLRETEFSHDLDGWTIPFTSSHVASDCMRLCLFHFRDSPWVENYLAQAICTFIV